MKVDFDDVEFGLFEPHETITYKGKEYKAITVPAIFDDGSFEWHKIAHKGLEEALAKEYGGVLNINCDLDDSISYYADNNDGVYYALEQIIGEPIVSRISACEA